MKIFKGYMAYWRGCRETELIKAVRTGDVQKALELASTKGYPVDAMEPWRGNRALHHICANPKYRQVFKAILLNGADPKCENFCKNVPLFMACNAMDIFYIRELCRRGQNPNHQNDWGRTPLMRSARWNHVEGIRALYEFGADLNMQDKDGCTAAMWAAEYGCYEALLVLKKLGADFALKDKNRFSVMDYAKESEDERVIAFVKETMQAPTVQVATSRKTKQHPNVSRVRE